MLGVMDVAAAAAMGGELCFLDVREPYEWDAGHIEGSLHIPIRHIGSRFRELQGNDPIVVVCEVGQRSALVADFLAARGFDVHNLEGGLRAWTSQGHPLIASASTSSQVVEGWASDIQGNRLVGRND
jgi:rhodanese-related sulfurtransferase